MEATRLRRIIALLLSAVLLAGLTVISMGPVGADDDEDERAVNVDAFEGLGANAGGSDTSEPAGTGDLDDPLGGGSQGSSDDAGTGVTSGSDPGTTDGSDGTVPAAQSANPMFKLMLDLILEDVQAAEARARAAGQTLSGTQRAAVAAESVQGLIAFLQESGLLGEVDTRELLKQIEAVPAEPSDSPRESDASDDE